MCSFYKKDFIYLFLFINLTLSSVLVHSNFYYEYTIIADKINIYLVAFYGFYTLYKKYNREKLLNILLVFLSFIYIIYIYYYGYVKQKYCFDTYKQKAKLYHSTMHIIGSIGNNIILFL